MRFAYLGSGSRGNAMVVSHGQTHVLLDCGLNAREAGHRMRKLGIDPDTLSAILVTHEHGDHIGGVDVLSRRHQVPVFTTRGTSRSHKLKPETDVRVICTHTVFSVGDLEIQPYPVPHDCREPCQFTFSTGAHKLGVLSDVGHVTPHIVDTLQSCDALALEFNHCPDMLAIGPYPPRVKDRVGGPLGHLSNQQAAELLTRIETGRLQHLVLAHLSEQNNTPELAVSAASEAAQCDAQWVQVAHQDDGLDWRDVV